jgi:hypothetical protein
MATKQNPLQFDKRIVERNIRKGVVKREDYDKHVAALRDVADQAEPVEARLNDDESGEEELSDEG